jgi:hypothetical protein
MTLFSSFYTRLFLGFMVVGLGCFAGLAWIAAYSHTEKMVLVMLLYFSGSGFIGIGVLGLLARALKWLYKLRLKSKLQPP